MEKTSEEDLAALDRILLRLSGTSNEALPALCISLMPRLLKLGNDELLRRKVIEVVTEVTRRVKVASIKLDVACVAPALHSSNLPFAANIAIGFLDSISSSNCAQVANVETVQVLLEAISSYDSYTYHSNALLFYALKFASAVKTVDFNVHQQSIVLVYDYMFDVLLLREFRFTAEAGYVIAGLSEKRMTRLAQQRKQFEKSPLATWKRDILDFFLTGSLKHPFRILLMVAVIAKCDADYTITQKGVYLLNTMLDLKRGGSIDGNEVASLLDIIFRSDLPQQSNKLQIISSERTPLAADFQLGILQDLSKFWSKVVESPLYLLSQLYHGLVVRHYLTRDSGLLVITALGNLIIEHKEIDDVPANLLLEGVWIQLQSFAGTANANNSTAFTTQLSARQQVYTLFEHLLSTCKVTAITQDRRYLLQLLTLAEADELSNSTSLFTILQKLRDTVTVAAYDDKIFIQQVRERLTMLRLSTRVSSQMLYLTWTKTLLGTTIEYFQTLLLHAESTDEVIQKFIENQFVELEVIVTQNSTLTSEIVSLQEQRKMVVESIIDALQLTTDPAQLLSKKGSLRALQVVFLALQAAVSESDLYAQNETTELLLQTPLFANCMSEESAAKLFDILSKVKFFSPLNRRVSLVHVDCRRLWCLFRRDTTHATPAVVVEKEDMIMEQMALLLLASLQGVSNHDAITEQHVELLHRLLSRPEKVLRLVATHGLISLQHTHSNLIEVQGAVEKTRVANGNYGTLTEEDKLVLAGQLALISHHDQKHSESVELIKVVMNLIIKMQQAIVADKKRLEAASDCILLTESLSFLQHHSSLVTANVEFEAALIALSSTSSDNNTNMIDIYVEKLQLTLASQTTIDVKKVLATETDSISLAFTLIEQLFEASTKSNVLEKALEEVLTLIETEVQSETEAEKKPRLMLIIPLIILAKQLPHYFPETLSFKVIDRMLQLLLQLLRRSTMILSDLCTLGLTSLYYTCTTHLLLPGRIVEMGVGMQRYNNNVSDYIAAESAVMITRRKKVVQPIGFDPAARGSSSNNAGNVNTNEQQQLPEEIRNLIPLPEAGVEVRDLLLDAANRMTARQNAAGLDGQTAPNTTTADENNQTFGVYTKLCSIARKCNDNAVVMIVLALVRSDVSFGTGETTAVLAQYCPPTVRLDLKRVEVLLPSLYLTRYEPVASARDLFRRVWRQLMPITPALETELIERCHNRILQAIAEAMQYPSWHDREASALALEAFLVSQRGGGASWSVIEPHCDILLRRGLKLLDDIRESTRQAAIAACKALMSLIARACNPLESDVSTASKAVASLLPIILQHGVVSPSVEARGFSLGLLLRIVEVSGVETLYSWLDGLVDALLESLSAMEPQLMQYVSFHTNALQVSSEQWEAQRVALAQHSPMHDALRKCLTIVPVDLLPVVCSTIHRHLRHGVGLATRAASADSLSFLTERFPSGLGGIGLQVLQALSTMLSDQRRLEPTLQKAALHAYGSVAKVSGPVAVAEELEGLCKRWIDGLIGNDASLSGGSSVFGGRDLDSEINLAGCMRQLLRRASEASAESSSASRSASSNNDRSLWDMVLSISLTGAMDNDEAALAAWQEVLNIALDVSGVGTKQGALQRCSTLLAGGMIPLMILDASWTRRKQAVKLLATLLTAVGGRLTTTWSHTMAALLLSLPGNAWDGRHEALDALGDLFSSVSSTVPYQSLQDNTILTITSSEGSPLVNISKELLSLEESLEALKETQQTVRKLASDQLSILHEMELKGHSKANTATMQWAVGKRAIPSLLLRETKRGDDQHKLAAARTLSLLPWNIILSDDSSDGAFEILTTLRELVGLVPLPIVDLDAITATTIAPPAPSQQAVTVPARAKPATNTAAMFGSRYGTAPAKSSKPPRKLARMENPASPAVAAPVTLQPALNNLPPYPYSQAFRAFMLKAIAALLSTQAFGAADPVMEELALLVHQLLRGEGWAVRVAALQLIATLFKEASVLSSPAIAASMSFCREGLKERKHQQVRLGSLICLEAVLKSNHASLVIAEHGEGLHSMVREASMDPQASVMEAATRLQTMLL